MKEKVIYKTERKILVGCVYGISTLAGYSMPNPIYIYIYIYIYTSKLIGPLSDLYILGIIYFLLTYVYVSSLLLLSENI